jgi:phenylacetate-CoA ligase
MLIVRGVNVFPSQIERVLLEFGELEPHYQIMISRGRHELDSLEIWVEGADSLFMPVDTHRLETLATLVSGRMREALGIQCLIKLMKPQTLERSQGKAVRVVDQRQLDQI